MSVQALMNLHQGNLTEALTDLQTQIKKDPSNAKLRVFLFQLLLISGQWERALVQLRVVGELDASTLLMVQTYRAAIECEALRAKVFSGEHSPLIFGQPQQWIALLVEGLRLDAIGQSHESARLRNQAFELAPTNSGRLDDVAFQWIADADSRLGPILEAIVDGRYYWIPFQQIQKIQLEKPTDLRDLVWMPAQFTWINGGESSGLIPTRYPGSENSEDALIRLSRKTEWTSSSDGMNHGWGQRLLATDVDDHPLMDIRHIEFDAVSGQT